jgi:hypothetical protein
LERAQRYPVEYRPEDDHEQHQDGEPGGAGADKGGPPSTHGADRKHDCKSLNDLDQVSQESGR